MSKKFIPELLYVEVAVHEAVIPGTVSAKTNSVHFYQAFPQSRLKSTLDHFGLLLL